MEENTNSMQQPPQEPIPKNKLKKPSKKLLIIAAISLLIMSVVGYVIFAQKPDAKTARSDEYLPAKVVPATNNKYKVFRTSSSMNGIEGKPAQYTLLNDTGQVAYQGEMDDDLQFITPVGDDSFLFFQDKPLNDINNTYYLLTKDGFKNLENLPEAMDRQAAGIDSPTGVVGYDSESILYRFCKASETDGNLTCYMNITNLFSGKSKTIKVEGATKGWTPLLNISSDNKLAYFLSESKKSDTALTEGATMENDIIVADIASGKIVAKYPVQIKATYYSKYWLSPNGRHLLYSEGGELGELQYVSVKDGALGTIVLPTKEYATEPWGGRTVTYDPQFSPDGNKMAFVSYEPSGTSLPEVAGVIDLNKKTSFKIAEESKLTTEEQSYYASTEPHFGNFRWINDNSFDFSAGDRNQNYNISTAKLTDIVNKYGTLIGMADDLR